MKIRAERRVVSVGSGFGNSRFREIIGSIKAVVGRGDAGITWVARKNYENRKDPPPPSLCPEQRTLR